MISIRITNATISAHINVNNDREWKNSIQQITLFLQYDGSAVELWSFWLIVLCFCTILIERESGKVAVVP